MKQKITLVLAILCSLYSFGQVGTKFKLGGIEYRITAASTVEVDQNNTSNATIAIPAMVNYNSVNYQVTSIGLFAFRDFGSLTSITIPNSITNIGSNAFAGCYSLISVTIPDSVTSIGIAAFANCARLTSVYIGAEVTSIGARAFMNCISLSSVTIPNKVTNIDISTFNNCVGLIAVSVPNSVTSIGLTAFALCERLTSINIPNSVTSIGEGAFSKCSGLTSVIIPSSVTSIGASAFGGCASLSSVNLPASLSIIGRATFYGCKNITSITVPNSVVSIGYDAFRDCLGLTSVTIGNAVTSIGSNVFSGCDRLSSFTVNWTTPLTINTDVFYGLNLSSRTLHVPVGTLAAYEAKAVWTDFNPIVEQVVAPILNQTFTSNGINYTVTKATLPYEAAVGSNTGFVGAAAIPANVTNAGNAFAITSIGERAFIGSALTSVEISNTVVLIGVRAFDNCANLKSINIPNSVITIGDYAFISSGLTTVSFPNSVSSIGDYAFRFCSRLYSISFSNSLTRIGVGVFSLCSSLTSANIPNSVTSIGDGAFSACSRLTSVTIPSSVSSIAAAAFGDCTALKNVSVNWATPLIINNNVFVRVNLSNILLSVPVGKIATYDASTVWTDFSPIVEQTTTPLLGQTFNSNGIIYFVTKATVPYEAAVGYDTNFAEVATIPASVTNAGYTFAVTSIGDRAFDRQNSLKSVTIPNSVTSIGSFAFSFCSGLTSVNIPNAVTNIGNSAFNSCTGLTSVNLPHAVTSIGNNAFEFCTGLTAVTIGNSVTSIGSSSFARCTGLTSISIPNGVTNIGDFSFSGCTRLSSLTVNWTTPLTINANVFSGVNLFITTLNVPSGTATAYKNALVWKDFGTIVQPVVAPALTSLLPTTASTGTTVTITGTNFTGATAVSFGGTAATSFTVVNATTITAIVGSGASGSVSVTTAGGTATLAGFTFCNPVTPTFTAVAPICSGASLSALPTTSTNAITGTWSPALNNAATTTYTFTPSVGQCANTTTLTIMVNPLVTPTFTAISAICSGGTLAALPTASTNAITGTWSPALNNLATTTYTFTPSVGQCANTTTLTITVNPRITPTFTAVSPICSGATLAALPTTSNNAIAGTWSPALNNLATTTYTFTPSVGQCATIATLAITVNITTAPTAAAQILNIGSTVESLAATGSNLQWYSTISGGAALASTTVLSSGTYYVSQTLNGCESTRTSIAVTITIPSTLSFCSGSKLAEAVGTTSLKFYSALTGGTALVSTTTLTTKTYYATQNVNGLESTPRVAVAITAIALPATPATITGTAAQGALVGTTSTANYSIAAVAGASSYAWTAPTGVNIVSGQGTNAITINFTDVPAGAGAIGNLSVVAVNSNDCESLVRNLALTKALPTAPTAIRMTDALLPIPTTGIPTAVTSFAQYMGTTRVVTLTATPVAGATAYEWELPSGLNLLSGATTSLGITSGTNEITVNFADVTSGNTFNHTTTTGVLTHVLRIGVKALTGTGASTTSNAAAILPETNSTARLLTLRAVLPAAPSAIRMTDAIAVDPLRAVTVISNFIGTTKEFTLTATPSALARSYTWELPAGVTQLSGGLTNTITVNFANVASGTTSLYIGVKAVNGIGASVTATNGTLVPATTSTARLLRLSATVPATVTAIGGQIAGLCGNATYSYTITPTILATAYSITAPIGAIVQSANSMANNTNSLTTPDLNFTVTYPTGFVATTATPKTLAVAAVNGVGSSTLSRSLNLSTLMPAIGTVTGSAGITNFRRTGTQTFTIPTVAGATSYTWTVANGAVITLGQGTTTVTVDFGAVPVAVATTKVAVIATNSCGVNSAIKSVSLTSVAAREAAKAKVEVNATEVYPNPVSSNFNIDVTASGAGNLSVAIYSLDGNLVVSPKRVALQEGTNTITENVAYLPHGVYILQLVNATNNEVITKKLIKG